VEVEGVTIAMALLLQELGVLGSISAKRVPRVAPFGMQIAKFSYFPVTPLHDNNRMKCIRIRRHGGARRQRGGLSNTCIVDLDVINSFRKQPRIAA